MCIGGGGSSNNSAALQQQAQIAAQQAQQTQELSDKQIAAQKEISGQQAVLNEKQFAAQQEQYAQQQAQADQQAQRQSEYDTGRAQVLGEGTQKVSDAFSRFSPDYFNKYAQDYMAKAQDQIDYQKAQARKDLAFTLSRQGLSSSQAGVNQFGLIDETAGRATAEQTANAQQAAASLQANTVDARQNLINQVAASTNIGSPIAGRTIEDVGNALQTQKSAVSGVASNAGDTVASLQAVPNPGTLGTLFSGVLGAGGSLLGGIQAGNVRTAVNRGLAGTSPSGGGSTRLS